MKKLKVIIPAVIIVAATVVFFLIFYPQIVTEKMLSVYEEAVVSKNYSEAVHALERLNKIEPDNIDIKENLARAYYLSGNESSAIPILEDLLEGNPENVDYLVIYASTLVNASEDAGGDSSLLFKAGEIYHSLGYLSEAEEYSRQAIDMEHENLEYAIEYATILMDEKKYAEAIEFLDGTEAMKEGNELAVLYMELTEKPVPPVFSKDGCFIPDEDSPFVEIYGSKESYVILYTLDGSDPDINSSAYTGPIDVSEAKDSRIVLKAVAMNANGLLSEVSSAHFTQYAKFEEPVIAQIVADHFGVDTDAITPEMLDEVESIEVWGTESGINVPWNDFINVYGGDGYIYGSKKLHGEITTLNDITEFRNLKTLSINYCKVSEIPDLSPLVGLETIRLFDNKIADVSAFSGMTGLKELYLAENRINNITPLTGLSTLKILSVSKNLLSSLPDFSLLTSLERGYFNKNQINDISGISNNTNLIELNLSYNHIVDISDLVNHTKLVILYLNNNQIADISALSAKINLQMLYINNNKISDVSPIKGCWRINTLNASGNMIKDVTPFFSLYKMKLFYFTNNGVPFDHSRFNDETWPELISLEIDD